MTKKTNLFDQFQQYLAEVKKDNADLVLGKNAPVNHKPFEKWFNGRDRFVIEVGENSDPMGELEATTTTFNPNDEENVGRQADTELKKVYDWLIKNGCSLNNNGTISITDPKKYANFLVERKKARGEEPDFSKVLNAVQKMANSTQKIISILQEDPVMQKWLCLDEESQNELKKLSFSVGDAGKDEKGRTRRVKQHRRLDQFIADKKDLVAKLQGSTPSEQLVPDWFIDFIKFRFEPYLKHTNDADTIKRARLIKAELDEYINAKKAGESVIPLGENLNSFLAGKSGGQNTSIFAKYVGYLSTTTDPNTINRDWNKREKMLSNYNKLDSFVADVVGQRNNVIVVSRVPIDILRMSDHKKNGVDIWTSCHSPPGDGRNSEMFSHAVEEAKSGGAIAYLVNKQELQEWLKEHDLQDPELFADEEREQGGIVPIARVKIKRLAAVKVDSCEYGQRVEFDKNVRNKIKSKVKSAKKGSYYDFASASSPIYKALARDKLYSTNESIDEDVREPVGGDFISLPLVGLVYGSRPYKFFQDEIIKQVQDVFKDEINQVQEYPAVYYYMSGGTYNEESFHTTYGKFGKNFKVIEFANTDESSVDEAADKEIDVLVDKVHKRWHNKLNFKHSGSKEIIVLFRKIGVSLDFLPTIFDFDDQLFVIFYEHSSERLKTSFDSYGVKYQFYKHKSHNLDIEKEYKYVLKMPKNEFSNYIKKVNNKLLMYERATPTEPFVITYNFIEPTYNQVAEFIKTTAVINYDNKNDTLQQKIDFVLLNKESDICLMRKFLNPKVCEPKQICIPMSNVMNAMKMAQVALEDAKDELYVIAKDSRDTFANQIKNNEAKIKWSAKSGRHDIGSGIFDLGKM